ncbi:MAG: glycosyltransferase family A protein [Deltaproteobacteria bacterium]|nr:glycosyltransferase family A protein [Deltaproteobacteria bacterium]
MSRHRKHHHNRAPHGPTHSRQRGFEGIDNEATLINPHNLDVGVVVIGRNEGERLSLCIDALLAAGVPGSQLVYVDSGSSDGSLERMQARGVDAIAVEAPFTAAKGRNGGFQHLVDKHGPALLAVQFVDGDCEYLPAWIDVASNLLREDPTVAAVSGRMQERHPEASVYNLLADLEWNGVVGDIDTFAGNVMVRVDALQKAGLYNPHLIAGEDPELSIRVRKATGQRIVLIDEPMCLHDVDMTTAGQWWRRCVRAGHAYAQVSRMHGEAPRNFWKKETRSIWLWGALPVVAPALAGPAWGMLAWRIYAAARRRGLDAKSARTYALYTTAAKVPQAVGQLMYWVNELRGVKSKLIEYKGAAAA